MAYFHIVFNLYHTTGLYNSLREKCPNTEFSLVRIFLHLNWIQENTTSYLDTFQVVTPYDFWEYKKRPVR